MRIHNIRVWNCPVQVTEAGSGEPLLLLHGNPDSAAMWQLLMQQLSPNYRCYAPDLPGFGNSDIPTNFDFSLSRMSEWIEAVRLELNIVQPLTLLVHDFGGPYGLSWAIEHPASLRRLVCFNTLYFEAYRWHFWGRVWRTPVLGEFSMLLMNRLIFKWELRRGSPSLGDAHIQETYGRIRPETRKMILALYRATDSANFAGWEEKMRMLISQKPSLVLWGDQDPYLPVWLANRFGTATVHHFERNGHWLPLEAPNAVMELLLPFLQQD